MLHHEPRDPECLHCDSASRSASPEPSLYSISSSRDGHILRNFHDRTFNALCETYMLPADEPEFLRQNRIHEVFKLHFQGGLCTRQDLLDSVLNATRAPGARPKAVLDLGSGSGAWLRDMAERYPHVEFTGVDLAPQTSGYTHLPDNVTLEIDDINLGLTHWVDQFDVVHVQSVAFGITDYRKLLREIHHILRPGGLMLLVEPDLEIFHDNGSVLEAFFDDKRSGSWTARVLFEAYQALKRTGASVEAGLMHERWLKEIPGFVNVRIEKLYNPIGAWMAGSNEADTRRLRRIGELMEQNTKDLIIALRPLLLADGYFQKGVDNMVERAVREMSEPNLRRQGLRLFSKWNCAVAVKA